MLAAPAPSQRWPCPRARTGKAPSLMTIRRSLLFSTFAVTALLGIASVASPQPITPRPITVPVPNTTLAVQPTVDGQYVFDSLSSEVAGTGVVNGTGTNGIAVIKQE